ncbi:serine hydroxymethyltransferase [Candidatus Peregrinibacteria bacterium]|nr:serine hydroxymethyltransferase [Candidatus Peregrinibacteria bacterium]
MQYSAVKATDPLIYELLLAEEKRQKEGLELIPSENYASRAVMEAMGSVFTNKYSEGYPHKRYYGGQENTDGIEELAIERACKLFDCKYANVQPHAGAPANIATYFALMEPGDTLMGMDLSHGGHLTHGHPVTYITKIFNFVRYKMKDVNTGEIDFDEFRKVAREAKPKVILAGYSAYPRDLEYDKFVEIAKEVGAIAIADVAHIAGCIAGGAMKNPFHYGFDVVLTTTHKTLRGPRGGMILTRDNEEIATKINKSIFPGFQGGPLMNMIAAKAVCFEEALQPEFKEYAHQIIKNAKAMEKVFHERKVRMITGGTSNHLILMDVQTSFGVNGHDAQEAMDEAAITLNKNMIADDPNPAMRPSGIRFGTPALTTRGMKEPEMEQIAHWMVDILKNMGDTELRKKIRLEVNSMALKFPVQGVG